MTLTGLVLQQNNMLQMLEQRRGMMQRVVSDQSLAPPPGTGVWGIPVALPAFKLGSLICTTGMLPSQITSGSSPAQRMPADLQPLKTGVYFNNCEIQHDMHPLQIRFSNRYTSAVRSLPAGKPMPQAPTLAGKRSADCVRAIEQDCQASPDNVEARASHKGTVKTEGREGTKRKREAGNGGEGMQKGSSAEKVDKEAHTTSGKHRRVLSKERVSFIEAALALSELSTAPPKPSPKLAAEKSPRSVLQALPPPPFFLPSHHLDLKDIIKHTSL